MMSVQRTIKSFVLHHYGNLISAEEPEFNEQTKTWIAQIKSDYPIVFQDDRTPEKKIVRFIPIKQIGTIRFNENLKVLRNESTLREECVKTIQTLIDVWRDRTERIVVQASADYFVRVPEFTHFFTPMQEAVDYLLEYHVIYDDDLMKYRSVEKQRRVKQYLKLLEGLDFIRRVDNGYESGEMFLFLLKEYETENGFKEDEFRKAILSEVIRKRYSALRDVFEISRLEPTIHLDSCIYRPSLETEELIYFSKRTIARNYRESHGRINPVTLTHILRRLRAVGAIDRSGDYWSGTEKLLSDMLHIKNQMPELAPPITAH